MSLFSKIAVICLLVAPLLSAEQFNTILVIYGQLRTFPLTCSGIFEHVVKQNAPCKVIINIDGGDAEKAVLANDVQIQSCLQNYLGTIDYIVEGIRKKTALHHGMEFDLMDRAIDHIEANNYQAKYLIKVRSDNFINAPIDIATAFGTSPSFITKFMAYQQHYTRSVTPNAPSDSFTLADHLWPWVFTAGIPQLIRPMFLEPSPSPWSFLNATAWNKDMKGYIYTKYNQTLPSSTTREYYAYNKLVRDALTDIHQHFKVAYLMGRTWVHFGPYETIASVSRGIVKDYGYLGWNVSTSQQKVLPPDYQWPFTGATLAGEGHRYDIFEWREVTESQFRLEHWKQGLNLVDMQNAIDDRLSFHVEPDSLWANVGDERIVAYLLRMCDGKNPRADCSAAHRRHRRRN